MLAPFVHTTPGVLMPVVPVWDGWSRIETIWVPMLNDKVDPLGQIGSMAVKGWYRGHQYGIMSHVSDGSLPSSLSERARGVIERSMIERLKRTQAGFGNILTH